MSTPNGLAPDASTSATQADAWTQAENNALASATQFDNTARTARQQAGLLAGRPDMTSTTKRLNQEATAAEATADTRRGMARGYAALRSLQDGEPTGTAGQHARTVEPTITFTTPEIPLNDFADYRPGRGLDSVQDMVAELRETYLATKVNAVTTSTGVKFEVTGQRRHIEPLAAIYGQALPAPEPEPAAAPQPSAQPEPGPAPEPTSPAEDTYSYWETGNPPANPRRLTLDQLTSELYEHGDNIGFNQFTVKHWLTGAEWEVLEFMEQASWIETEEEDEEDRSGNYRLWETDYPRESTMYAGLDELLDNLKAMATPEADDENKIYRGRFVVQQWSTKEKFDAVDFLATHGVTVPEDYDSPGTVYRLYYDKQQPYSYMAFDDLGELVDEYYGQGIDIGIRRKQNVLNKVTGETTDVVDILATVDFTAISIPRYEVWETRFSDQREVPMEIEANTLEDVIDGLVDLELSQGDSAVEPGIRSIFDYSTGKESDVAAFMKKHRKLVKATRAQKAQ